MRAPLVLLAGLSALGALLWVNRDAVQGLVRRSRQVRQELQRWEGEGGSPAVPAGTAPPTTDDAVAAASSPSRPLH